MAASQKKTYRRKNSKPSKDLYQIVTDKIVSAIEAGAGDFQMPWHHSGTGLNRPINALTNKTYRGSNVLNLWIDASAHGYTSGTWATYKQWQELGCRVRAYERAALIIYFKTFENQNETPAGEEQTYRGFMAKPSYVFNADQVVGYNKVNPLPVVANPAEKIAHVENFIAATNAKIEIGGQKAFYRLSDDTIHVPDPRLFVGTKTSTPTETYYSTMLHELGHWTGHKTRCNRDFGERFGNQKYAAEELVAELTAAFLCADLDIALEPRQDHAAYLNSWLTVLKNDKKAIFTAAAAANKASDFLHNLQPALQEKAA